MQPNEEKSCFNLKIFGNPISHFIFIFLRISLELHQHVHSPERYSMMNSNNRDWQL